jgi:hypothetical protein
MRPTGCPGVLQRPHTRAHTTHTRSMPYSQQAAGCVHQGASLLAKASPAHIPTASTPHSQHAAGRVHQGAPLLAKASPSHLHPPCKPHAWGSRPQAETAPASQWCNPHTPLQATRLRRSRPQAETAPVPQRFNPHTHLQPPCKPQRLQGWLWAQLCHLPAVRTHKLSHNKLYLGGSGHEHSSATCPGVTPHPVQNQSQPQAGHGLSSAPLLGVTSDSINSIQISQGWLWAQLCHLAVVISYTLSNNRRNLGARLWAQLCHLPGCNCKIHPQSSQPEAGFEHSIRWVHPGPTTAHTTHPCLR